MSAAATTGLEIAIDLGALASASDTVQISEIDLSLAPNAAAGLVSFPPPVRLARIGNDLEFCQRYFETSYQALLRMVLLLTSLVRCLMLL